MCGPAKTVWPRRTSDNWLNLPETQFPDLRNGDKNISQGLVRIRSEAHKLPSALCGMQQVTQSAEVTVVTISTWSSPSAVHWVSYSLPESQLSCTLMVQWCHSLPFSLCFLNLCSAFLTRSQVFWWKRHPSPTHPHIDFRLFLHLQKPEHQPIMHPSWSSPNLICLQFCH